MIDFFRKKKQDLINEFLSGNKINEYGAHCSFYKTKNMGLKVYTRKKTRDNAFKFQSGYNQLNLAPKTYGIIDLKNSRGKKYYGYYTQLAKMDTRMYDVCGSYVDEHEINTPRGVVKLTERMRNSFHLIEPNHNQDEFSFLYDIHYLNVGYIRGRLVCVDFT